MPFVIEAQTALNAVQWNNNDSEGVLVARRSGRSAMEVRFIMRVRLGAIALVLAVSLAALGAKSNPSTPIPGLNGKPFIGKAIADDGTVVGSSAGVPVIWTQDGGTRSLATGDQAGLKGAATKVANHGSFRIVIVAAETSPLSWKMLKIPTQGAAVDISLPVGPEQKIKSLTLIGIDGDGTSVGNGIWLVDKNVRFGPVKVEVNGDLKGISPPSQMNGFLYDAAGRWTCGVLTSNKNPDQGEQAAVYNPSGTWVYPLHKGTNATSSVAYAVSSSGEVVGYLVKAGKKYPFLWTPQGNRCYELGTVEGEAVDINNQGQIVGVIGGQAALYDRAQNTWRILKDEKGRPFNEAVAINQKGAILVNGQNGCAVLH